MILKQSAMQNEKPDTAKETAAKESGSQRPGPAHETSTSAGRGSRFQRILPWLVLLTAAAILFVIIVGWNSWVGGGGTQKTDDAFVRSDITPLSTKVSGTVQQVAVADYQRVKAGDLLVQLKDDDFQAQVVQAEAGVAAALAALDNNAKQKEQQAAKIMQAYAGLEGAQAGLAQAKAAVEAARADIANAQANVDAAEAKIPDAEANIDAAAADAEQSLLERRRQEALVNDGSATRQNLEQVVANQEKLTASLKSRKAELAQAHASVESRQADLAKARAQLLLRRAEEQRAMAQIASTSAELDGQKKQRAVLEAQESQLKADLDAKHGALQVAQTNLEYTRILAPANGIVGEREVRMGQMVSPGTHVISLVDNTIWVQANYKETQLRNVARGDEAEVTVDTFPGLVLRGHVEEISPASGSQFALLPPDNATGNYTKIVQRIPVKIVLDADPAIAERLRPGMSVIAEIKTRARHKR